MSSNKKDWIKESEWRAVKDYICKNCKKKRSTRDKERAKRKVCTKCEKVIAIHPGQQVLF